MRMPLLLRTRPPIRGLYIGAISASTGASTNTGVKVTSIAGTSANAYGINIGAISGATTANYWLEYGGYQLHWSAKFLWNISNCYDRNRID